MTSTVGFPSPSSRSGNGVFSILGASMARAWCLLNSMASSCAPLCSADSSGGTGRVTVNAVPSFSALLTEISPESSRTRACVKDKPMPELPSSFRL